MFKDITGQSPLILKDGYGIYKQVKAERVDGNVIVACGQRFDRTTGVELSNPSWKDKDVLLPFTAENVKKLRRCQLVQTAWGFNHTFLCFACWEDAELEAYISLVTKVKERLEGAQT